MDNLGSGIQALPGFFQIVNIIVLFSALFFFTSTIASHVVEIWVGWRNSRGQSLRDGLSAALGRDVVDAIYNDPLIRSLSSGRNLPAGTVDQRHPPSYLEPEFFARVTAKMYAGDGVVSKSEVLRDIKETLAVTADDFEPKIIEWFQAITDRQIGVYTRWTFLRLILIGFLLAVSMDIDTVHIAGTLWNNPEQAKKATDALAAANNFGSKDISQLTPDEQKALQASIAAAVQQLSTIAQPDYAWQNPPKLKTLKDGKDWLAKLLGWVLTALATSLGAQFWFNMMSDALKVRSADPKPDDEAENNQNKTAGAGDAAAGQGATVGQQA